MTNATWTQEEINTLRSAFLQGQRIKQIASILGKTPTALNKALSRFGIRNTAPPKRYQWLSNSIPSQIIKTKEIKVQQQPTPIKSKKKSLRLRLRDCSIWVPLSNIVRYLKDKGILSEIIPTPNSPLSKEGRIYFLHSRLATPSQLILRANELRLEEKKPIFLVEGVTV